MNEVKGGDEHFAAHVATFFGGGKLVLVMHGGNAFFDHLHHQFVGVERTAETSFSIGHNREPEVRGRRVGDNAPYLEVVNVMRAVEHLDLVGALEGLVQAADN